MQQEQGAVGGDPQGYPPVNPQEYQPVNPQGAVNPPVNPANPANFQIVNEVQFFQLGKHHTACSTKMETAR